jgi:hypothetical protein
MVHGIPDMKNIESFKMYLSMVIVRAILIIKLKFFFLCPRSARN